MLKILKEYVENNTRVVEYTKDGETISHIVKTPIQVELPENNSQVTLEEQIAELKEDNLILMDALATVFEEVLSLKEEQSK